MKTAQYQPHTTGEQDTPLPPEYGTTGDDRMDIANTIGADLGLDIETALCIAERVLLSTWFLEVRGRIKNLEDTLTRWGIPREEWIGYPEYQE
jgi:hypothetical protein